MTETKHTPGPWEVCRLQSFIFGQRREDGGHNPVGFIYGPAFAERSVVGRRAIADSHLAAAAPELLEAGREVEAAWVALARALPQDDRIEALEWGAMQRLRAAIAKATGSAA